jgi:hypothetical protein
MGEQSLVCDRLDQDRSIWGHQPIRYRHRLHKLKLFGVNSLKSLVESFPREHASIVQGSDNGRSSLWWECKLRQLSGRELIEALLRNSPLRQMRLARAAVELRLGRAAARRGDRSDHVTAWTCE